MIVLVFFTLMVTCLLGFHSYLSIVNQTTCNSYSGENVSWEKISYLKKWPRKYGSPFSLGVRKNLYIYCCAVLDGNYQEWKVPSHLPLTPREEGGMTV
jgi:hypothetical protein